MALTDSDLSFAWAPAYASFQSFITAMRLLEGGQETTQWLRAVNKQSKSYADELGVVMAAEPGKVDIGTDPSLLQLAFKIGQTRY